MVKIYMIRSKSLNKGIKNKIKNTRIQTMKLGNKQ